MIPGWPETCRPGFTLEDVAEAAELIERNILRAHKLIQTCGHSTVRSAIAKERFDLATRQWEIV